MTRSDQQLQKMCQQLLAKNIGERAVEVSLDEFERLYSYMEKLTDQAPTISLVKSVGGELFAQFSEIAPQHFVIKDAQSVTPETFRFVSRKVWHGPKKPLQKFVPFVLDELRMNGIKLGGIFLTSAILLFFADQNKNNLYDLIATLLIQSGTVFFSIYLIFTVAQSQKLAEDKSLFENGVTHKYYSDDRNITLLAIFTLAAIFFNSMLVNIFDAYLLYLGIPAIAVPSAKALTTALVIAMLFDSFFTVANYYLGRTLDIIERDVISDILDSDFRNPKT